MIISIAFSNTSFVTSLAEVWIEIEENGAFPVPTTVTSLAEVWIEIARSDRL